MSAPGEISGPVLLFDGTCGLCNRCVRLLLRLDRRGQLRFAPLQGPSARAYLRRHGLPTEDFDSLIFVPEWARPEQGGHLSRTDGVVAALRTAGGFGAWCGTVLGWIPAGWRDAGYKVIARWRYRLWGGWRPRPLPRPEWAARFFD